MGALYNRDVLIDNVRGNYASRATTLMRKWIGLPMAASGSVWTAMGHHDSGVVLVFTGTGPEY